MIPEWFVLIPWYTKYYINNKGIVYREWWQDWFCFRKWRFIKPAKNKKRFWYLYVSLIEKWIKKKNWTLHRLVMLAFVWIKEWLEINHIDGDKSNNSLENLEWVTSKENKTHARMKGLYRDEISVIWNKDWIDYFFNSISEASRITWIDKSSICQMMNNTPKRNNWVTYYRKSAWGYVWRKSA